MVFSGFKLGTAEWNVLTNPLGRGHLPTLPTPKQLKSEAHFTEQCNDLAHHEKSCCVIMGLALGTSLPNS